MSEQNLTVGLDSPAMSLEPLAEQRVQPRLSVHDPADSEVLFAFPGPDGQECAAPIRDVSYGGVSFRLTPALLGIESGWTSVARLRFGTRVVHGHMLVVHVGPNPQDGSICGAMFFATSPEDRRTLRAVMSELGER